MRNAAYEIRVSSFVGLLGKLPSDVLVYDTFAIPTAAFPRVVLQQVTGGGQRLTKCGFGADWFQSIKVSNKFKASAGATQNENDRIVDAIFKALVPMNGPYITMENFHCWQAIGQVLNVLNYTDGADNYIDTDIQITYSLTQKDSFTETP